MASFPGSPRVALPRRVSAGSDCGARSRSGATERITASRGAQRSDASAPALASVDVGSSGGERTDRSQGLGLATLGPRVVQSSPGDAHYECSSSWKAPGYWTPGQCRGSQRKRLFLAPMEGLGDRSFRRAFSAAFPDSFDEASTEFLRLSLPADVCPYSAQATRCYQGLFHTFKYDPSELVPHSPDGAMGAGTPIALQLMISADQPELGKAFVEWIFSELPENLRPQRVDINMGCPSKRTTSRGQQLADGRTSRGGAGSSLLTDPQNVHNVTAAVREGLPPDSCCLSVKMRIGYDDDSLFAENLHAAAEHADFLQVHTRTKQDGYVAPARWERLAYAKQILGPSGCPVVGNGDVDSPGQYQRMLDETGVDGVMIGRAAVANPFIFYGIRSLTGDPQRGPEQTRSAHMLQFFEGYYHHLTASQQGHAGTARYERTVCGKLKQMIAQGFLTNRDVCPGELVDSMENLLRTSNASSDALFQMILNSIERANAVE